MNEMREGSVVHGHKRYWGQLSVRQLGANGDVQIIKLRFGN